MKSTKTTMLLLTFYLTTTQISVAHTNPWTWFIKQISFDKKEEKQTERNKKKEEEIPDQVSLEDYLTQLRHDLKPIPQRDIDEITNTARRKLRQLCDHERKNKDKVNRILRRAIVEHVETETVNIARNLTDDSDKINRLKKSMGKNIDNRLKKILYPNGEAIHQFFGNELAHMIYTSLPSFETHYDYEHQSQSYKHPETGNGFQKSQWHSNTKPSAPTYAD